MTGYLPYLSSDPGSGITRAYVINEEWAAFLASVLLEYETPRLYRHLTDQQATDMQQRVEELQAILLEGGNMQPYTMTLDERFFPTVMTLAGQVWTRRRFEVRYDPDNMLQFDGVNYAFSPVEDMRVVVSGYCTARNVRQHIARFATSLGGAWLYGTTGFSTQADNNTSAISHFAGSVLLSRNTWYAVDTWSQYSSGGVAGYDYTDHGGYIVTGAMQMTVVV